jgi:hypothetical protein
MATDCLISNEDTTDDAGHQVLKFSLNLGKIDLMEFCDMSLFFHNIIKIYSVLSNIDIN